MAKLPVGKLGSPGEDEGTRPARPNAKARELTATELARGSTEDLKPAGPGAGGKPTAKLSNRPKDVAKAIAATIQARRGTLRPSLVFHFRVPAAAVRLLGVVVTRGLCSRAQAEIERSNKDPAVFGPLVAEHLQASRGPWAVESFRCRLAYFIRDSAYKIY